MKFISWLLSASVRHRRGAVRYQKGGIVYKIMVIVVLLAFTGVTLGLEYWALSLFEENIVIGGLVSLLAIAFIFACIELNGIYCFFGFKSAKQGSLETVIEKNNKKRLAKGKSTDNFDYKGDEDKNERKSTKGLDLLIGFVGLILVIVTIFFAILLVVNKMG